MSDQNLLEAIKAAIRTMPDYNNLVTNGEWLDEHEAH